MVVHIPLGTRIDYINTNTGIYSEDPYFGTSVSLSSDGTILAVGANGFNVTSGQREGVHLYINIMVVRGYL